MKIVFVAMFGLIIGSFLNVCIYRIPKGESIAFPPSHCTSCRNRLKWYDLIPVLSYISLKGKCRYCREKISIRYMLVEIINAVIWVVFFLKYGISMEFLKFAFLCSFLIVMGYIDYDTQDVYFRNSVLGIILAIVFMCIEVFFCWKCGLDDYAFGIIRTYILGGVISSGILALIAVLTKAMGWGDVEVVFICGLFLGLEKSICMIFLSFVIGAIVGTILIFLKKKGRRDPLAFVPCIAWAAIIMILWGEEIINSYMGYFIM